MNNLRTCLIASLVAAGVIVTLPEGLRAGDWPMLGRTLTRNSTSTETGPPTNWTIGEFDPDLRQWNQDTSKSVRWVAALGSMTCGDPVVTDGLVWVGTNNDFPGESPRNVDASALACFRESDGQLLYKFVSPRLKGMRWLDWPYSSIACSPLVSGNRLWFVTNRWEIVCLDIAPLRRNAGEPQVIWTIDMMKEFGVHPYGAGMHFTRFASIASHNDRLYVVTAHGVDPRSNAKGQPVPAPEAPSLVCLEKDNGNLLWADSSPSKNILSGQWSSPLVVPVDDRVQVIVGQGDGWLRSFDASSGALIWKFDMNEKTSEWIPGGRGTRNSILATPVFYAKRVYLAVGQEEQNGEGYGRLCCIDPTKSGDISSQLAVDAQSLPIPRRRLQAVDTTKGERAIPNPNSGLVWEYTKSDLDGNGEIDFEEEFHRTLSSVAIKNGLLIAADYSGLVHCFDAASGKRHWGYDLLATCHSTPLIVDDKIYIADLDGRVSIFNLSADLHSAAKQVAGELKPINSNAAGEVNEMGSIFTSPIFANGTLYVATRSHLFAIERQPNESAAGTWPQWRGPNRDNVSNEVGLMQEWPQAGPSLEWRVGGIGQGIASISIADGRIYSVGYTNGAEYAFALDQLTGELIWATNIGEAVQESRLMRWLSQRSPTVDRDRVYFVRANGDLVCLQASDGVELWRKNYVKDFAAGKPYWGHCDYPLVDGNRLIISPGSPTVGIAALNKFTGDVIWQTKVAGVERAGHAAVVAATFDDVQQYLVYSDQGLFGVRATDGEILWHYDQLEIHFGNSHSPIVQGDLIFCATHRDGVAALKVVTEEARFRVEELYHRKRDGDRSFSFNLDPFQDTLTLVAGNMFGFRRQGLMLCYSASAGEVRWGPVRAQPRSGQASLTYADRRLYVRYADGTMTLVEANPEEYVERGKFIIPDHEKALGSTMPVICGGRMYLRDDDRLLCYDVRDGAESIQPPRVVQLTIPTDGTQVSPPSRGGPRSVFVPTPQDVVQRMLEMAKVTKDDLVYDLGSGDGRIVITAAKDYGCRAVGIEIDRELVEVARDRAKQADVANLVTFERKNVFNADFSKANVVAAYLLPRQLERLVPSLNKLKPGTRIVSHFFRIPGVEPDRQITFTSEETGEEHVIYLWTTPLDIAQ